MALSGGAAQSHPLLQLLKCLTSLPKRRTILSGLLYYAQMELIAKQWVDLWEGCVKQKGRQHLSGESITSISSMYSSAPDQGSHVGREGKPIGISNSGRGVSKRLGYMYEVGSGNDCI